MTSRLTKCLTATISIIALGMSGASAQDAPEPWDPNYEPPRMEDGTPSFAGVWSKASITSIERSPMFDTLVIPPEIAQNAEEMRARMFDQRNSARNPDEIREAPEVCRLNQEALRHRAFLALSEIGLLVFSLVLS